MTDAARNATLAERHRREADYLRSNLWRPGYRYRRGLAEHLDDAAAELERLAAVEERAERLEAAIRHVVADSPGTPDSVKKYLVRELEGSWGEPYERAALAADSPAADDRTFEEVARDATRPVGSGDYAPDSPAAEEADA